MSRAIINLFNDSKNQKGQLFFTTHDVTNLTNDIFRRDQIWFAEKDKFSSTQITSLIEYKFNNAKIRNDENYSKNYMQGKYGAIPFINFSYSELFDEDSSLEKDGEVSNGQI
ncbi:abortive phage resistance protein [Enterococcus casseliflavus]|nr:abortive phage resistance protein [Enterococcus casseliflavus]